MQSLPTVMGVSAILNCKPPWGNEADIRQMAFLALRGHLHFCSCKLVLVSLGLLSLCLFLKSLEKFLKCFGHVAS